MTFHELHHGGTPLLLPNAWDVPSALAFADAGYPAIGTTSFGVAATLGRPDAARVSRDANLGLAAALRGVPGYVTVDVEDGYADDPDAVAEYVAELAGLGVAGINIEDSSAEALIDPDAHAAKVAAVKGRLPDLFVNARVDTYWLGQDATPEATLARAGRYVEAGADGVFVPGASEAAVLREITAAVPVPVNTLVIPGMSLADLAGLGVRRVSTGSLPYRAALHAAVAVADAARQGDALPAAGAYPEWQERLVRYGSSR